MLSAHGLRIGNYPAQSVMAPHAHQAANISIVVRGEFVERIGPRTRDYARGQISFLPAGMVHSQTFGAAGARQVIFCPEITWLDYLAECRPVRGDSPHANAPTFGHLGDRLLEELLRDDEVSALACEGLMLEVIAAFARQGAIDRSGVQPPPWLGRAREFIEQHSLGSFRLRDVARAAGRHEVHLAREFRRFFGVSVGAHVRHLRTEEAARLLATKEPLSITEIALACGFSSHPHLCREFRRRYGVSPAQYRRTMR